MKLLSALAVLVAIDTVSSYRILFTQNASDQPQSLSTQNKPAPAGAAYFITNEPNGNFIVGSEIGTDGKLTFKHATFAGGRGAHGVTNAIGPDAFFSQGAIRTAGRSVFTVNAGSNTIAMFSIDPKDPANLRMVGRPVSTGGEFPVSVAVSKQSGQVCVLNGGRVNGVNCFKQDPYLGLIQIPNTRRSLNVNQTTPPFGPPGTVSDIIFNKDGTQLLASVKGVQPDGGFIASWTVNPTSGALSEDFTKSSGAPGSLTFSMNVIPGTDAIFTADPAIGFDIFNFRNTQQASSTAFPVPGQIAVCWSSFSQKTGDFYLIDIGASIVTEVHVNDNLQGTIVNQYPQRNGSSIIDNDIAAIYGKEYLYVLAPGTQSVIVLSLDAPGKTTPVQQFSFQDAVSEAGIRTNRNNLQGMALFVGQ